MLINVVKSVFGYFAHSGTNHPKEVGVYAENTQYRALGNCHLKPLQYKYNFSTAANRAANGLQFALLHESVR